MANTGIEWLSAGGLSQAMQFFARSSALQKVYFASDVVSALAFYSITGALVYFVRNRVNKRFNCIFILSALFMFVCGTGHVLSVWSIWQPLHTLDAAARVAISLLSSFIGVMVWPMVARAAPMPGSARLQRVIAQHEHELAERKNVEEALRQSQATLRELAAYQERIREDERKRIAREIHDDLGQNLLALRLDIAALHERAGERHPLLRERTANALDHIDTTMKSIRTIMNNLRPSVLDLGLSAAIEWQVRQFERRSGVPCELMMDDEGERVPDAQAIAVFRILQESLNNIGRHAHATYVRVELRTDSRHLCMAVKDNGIGMYPGDRRKMRRFGLVGIEERVTILGGEIHIDSIPGQGTEVRISIPMRSRTETQVSVNT